MIELRDARVGILCFSVVRATNFIMIAGPTQITRSTGSRSITCSSPRVTTPFCPIVPSSVMTIVSSATSPIMSSMKIRSLVLAPRIAITLFPASFIPLMLGKSSAIPTPPPMQTTVPYFLISVGLPRGPTMSVISSPTSRWVIFQVDTPAACMITSMRPSSGQVLAHVTGIRSPISPTRKMMKLPGRLDRAISGASIVSAATRSEICSFLTILYIFGTKLVTRPPAVEDSVK